MQRSFRPSRLFLFNFNATVGATLLMSIWAWSIGFRLPVFAEMVPLFMLIGIFCVIGLFYSTIRKDEMVVRSVLGLAILQAFLFSSGVLSYLGVTLRFPLVDPQLAAFDRMLGIDWPALIHWAADQKWICDWALFVYDKPFFVLPFAVMVLLILTNRGDRFEELVGFVVISTLITLTIGTLMPGISGYVYFNIPMEVSGKLGALLDLDFGTFYHRLRDGMENRFDLKDPKGLVAFPSYHTVVAIMLVLYVRHTRWLMIPMAIISTGVILTTPFIGGHYIVDILGGMAVAALSFACVRWLAKEPTRLEAPMALDAQRA